MPLDLRGFPLRAALSVERAGLEETMPGRLMVAALVGILVLSLAATAEAREPFPEGRVYFTLFEGLGDTPYEVSADCLEVGASELCLDDETVCLEWNRTEGGVQTRRQISFEFRAEFEQDGMLLELDGQGRADDRGARSSIAAVARLRAPELGAKINFSLSGRETSAAECRDLVEEFQAALGAQ